MYEPVMNRLLHHMSFLVLKSNKNVVCYQAQCTFVMINISPLIQMCTNHSDLSLDYRIQDVHTDL
jgi:hypothetical protein